MIQQLKQKTKLLGLLLILFVSGCDAQQEASSPYPTLDSGVTASTDAGDKIYWMDNDRVIFVSYGPKPKTVEENRNRKPAIYIWNTRNNKIEKYADGRQLCYHEGYIRYAGPERLSVPGTDFFVPPLYEGPLGSEKIMNSSTFKEGARKSDSGDKYKLNRYTCRMVKKPESMKGKVWLPLLEQHGALDWGTNTIPGAIETEQPLVYRRAPDGEASVLEIKRGDIGLSTSRYYVDFRDSYFFQEPVDARGARNVNCIEYWWMSQDGTTEKGCQSISPLKHLAQNGASLYPTRLGVFISTGKSNDYDAGTLALYSVNNNSAKKIIVGGHEKLSLSPDGCKLAFVYTPFYMAKRVGSQGEPRLKTINLCLNGGHNYE